MRFNMAIFHPSIEKINQFKVQPTDGERTLLNFLSAVLDDSFEVFFQSLPQWRPSRCPYYA